MRSPEGNHELRQLAGRPDDIWQRGDDWVKLAGVMERTSVELGAIGDSSVHKSKGTEKLGEKAAENEDDLYNAAQRYRDTGTVLRTYANALDTAQRWLTNNMASVEQAETAYQSAVDAKADAVSSEKDLKNTWPWEEDASASELSAAATAVTNANTSLTNATTTRDERWGEFDQVFETWEDAYDAAVTGIQKAMDTSGTNDGFWEAVDTLLDVIGVVLIVLTVIALIIGAPFTGLLALVITGLTLLVVGLTLLKFAFGRATLTDVALALVGLLPLGIGRVLTKGIPTLAAVVSGGRGVVTQAIRAGLPRLSLLRPTTWATPIRSAFAPVRSWLSLPRPGALVNPFRSLGMGGETGVVQIQTFLNTMRSSQWAANPGVQNFITATTGQLPSGLQRLGLVANWTVPLAWDVLGGADRVSDLVPENMQIQMPWGR